LLRNFNIASIPYVIINSGKNMENNSLNHPIDKTLPSGQAPRLLSNIDVGAVPLTLFIGIARLSPLRDRGPAAEEHDWRTGGHHDPGVRAG
jgi:hypothetical protein